MKVIRSEPERLEAIDVSDESLPVIHALQKSLVEHGHNFTIDYGKEYAGLYRLSVRRGVDDQFAAVGDKLLVSGATLSGLDWTVSPATRITVYSDTFDVDSDTPNNLSDFDDLFGGPQ